LVVEGMAGNDDLELIQVIDEPAEIVEAIFKHYEATGFDLTPAERNVQLYL
jgi:predicted Rossmann-fold nucleotide-binding protein